MISEKELRFKMGSWNYWKHEPRGGKGMERGMDSKTGSPPKL